MFNDLEPMLQDFGSEKGLFSSSFLSNPSLVSISEMELLAHVLLLTVTRPGQIKPSFLIVFYVC